MKRYGVHLLILVGTMLIFSGCSNKNSNEACVHQASMDLDAGNYDAVIASSCADAMQKGAAYFGRSGFDTTLVINTYDKLGVNSSQTMTTSDLTVYMTSLVGSVNDNTLNDLDSASTEYEDIPNTSDLYKNAQFNLSLVESVKGLSFIKFVISDVTGTLNTACDINSNGIADGADAEACTLIAASNISTDSTVTCGNNTDYSPKTPVDITFPADNKQGTYSGLVITLSGTATASCPSAYKKLLYKDSSGAYWAATTSANLTCTGSDGNDWPCPLEDQNGLPIDLATSINTSVNDAVESLSTSLTTTSTTVQTSIQNIQAQICPAGPQQCTQAQISINLADYLRTIQ